MHTLAHRSIGTIAAFVIAALAAATLAPSALAQPPSAGGVARVLVGFTPDAAASDRAQARAEVQAALVRRIDAIGVDVLEVPVHRSSQVIAALSRSPVVDYAEPDGEGAIDDTRPNDRHWSSQWGLAHVQLPKAWDRERGNPATVVAVLDTGVDYGHEDLQGAFVAGRNVVHNNDNPVDDHGHGTRVAGVVAARTDNRTGIAGTCWHCSVMPVKVANANGSVSWSDVATGITWATDNGAHVISMSLSGTKGNKTLERAVQYGYENGMVLLGSAGNARTSDIRYPSGYPEVVAVAGTDSADSLYNWSSFGSWVDISAPGCNYTTSMGNAYGNFCGTSSSTPLVAGIAGLARSLDPQASNVSIVAALHSGAIDIGSVVQYGRVDANATLALLGTGATTPPAEPGPDPEPGDDPEEPTAASETTTFKGTLNSKHNVRTHELQVAAGELALSLAFNRAPELVLRVIDASGAVVAAADGASVLSLATTVTQGSYLLEVSGSPASYTLTVTSTGAA